MNKQEWILKRNCSLSPSQLGKAYACLCFMSLAAGAFFLLHGAWQVFAFSLLEMAAVGIAFIHYGRHATDHEHVVLMDGFVLIECVCAGKTKRIELNAYWIKFTPPSASNALIHLEAKGVKIELGRYVTEGKRKQIAEEIRQGLHGSVFLAAQS